MSRRGMLARAVDEVTHWRRASWSLAEVAEHYDRLAEDYDHINEATAGHFRRFTDALRLTSLAHDTHLLELFARTGEGTAYLYQQGKVRSAVCVDVSLRMGELCRQRLEEAGLTDFQWVQLADYSLPFPASEFDAVLCLETVEHVSQPARLVTELARVAKPGGTLVLSTPNVLWEPVHALAAVAGLHHSEGPHRFIQYGKLLAMVEGAGFRIAHKETNVLVPGGPRWIVGLGYWMEQRATDWLMGLVGLRRMLVCHKLG